MKNKVYKISKTDNEWKTELSSDEFKILREKGNEPPYTGIFNNQYETGISTCKGCGNPLYTSDSKFNSSCGWPSYDASLPEAIEYIKDDSHGMLRTEIVCANCGGHQGHLFSDGPTSTGERYCVNAASIDFSKEKK